jgi:phage terminase small subunit
MAERKAAPGPKQAPRASSQRSKAKDQQTPDNLPSRDLNPRQRAFVVEYLKDKNATQAYMRAYGASQQTADTAGPRLYGNARIQSEIVRLESEALAQVQRETGITLERTLREIARLGFFDPRRLLDAKGNPKPLHELDDDTAAAIAGLDVQQIELGSGDSAIPATVKKYKLADKNASLEKLMKHLGGYKEDHDQSGNAAAKALAGLAVRFVEPGAA